MSDEAINHLEREIAYREAQYAGKMAAACLVYGRFRPFGLFRRWDRAAQAYDAIIEDARFDAERLDDLRRKLAQARKQGSNPMTDQLKINWRPMSEVPEVGRRVLIADAYGDTMGYTLESSSMRERSTYSLIFTGKYGWCYADELNIPTEPIKPKPREPKPREPRLGEVWDDAEGTHWMFIDERNGAFMQASDGSWQDIDLWMRNVAPTAKLVLEAPEECDD